MSFAQNQIQRESFRESDSDTSGGLSLDVEVSGQTGNFTIKATVDSSTFGEPLPGPGAQFIPSTLRVRPASTTRIRNAAEGIVFDISSNIDTSATSLRTLPGVNVLSINSSDLRFTEDLGTGTLLPADFDFGVEFTPITIPVQSRDELNEISSFNRPSITVSVVPNSIFGIISQTLPSVTIELPPEAFIATADLSSFECDEIYRDIERQLNSIRTEINNTEPNGLQFLLGNARDLRNRLQSTLDGDITLSNVRSQAEQGNINQSLIQEVQNFVDGLPSEVGENTAQIANIQSRVDDLDTNVGLQRCAGTFNSQIQELENNLSDIRELNEIVNTLENISGLGIEDLIPCAQLEVNGERVFAQAQDRLDGVRQTLSTVDSLSANDFSTIRNDLQSAEEATQELEQNTNRNDCISSLNQTISELRNRVNTLRDCGTFDAFTEAQDNLNQVESILDNLEDEPVNAVRQRESDINNLLDDVRSLRSDLRGEAPSGCIQQIADDINDLENRFSNLLQINCENEPQFTELRRQVNEFTDVVQGTRSPSDSRRQTLLNRSQNIRSSINTSDMPNLCKSRLTNDLDSAVNTLRRSSLQSLRERLREAAQQPISRVPADLPISDMFTEFGGDVRVKMTLTSVDIQPDQVTAEVSFENFGSVSYPSTTVRAEIDGVTQEKDLGELFFAFTLGATDELTFNLDNPDGSNTLTISTLSFRDQSVEASVSVRIPEISCEQQFSSFNQEVTDYENTASQLQEPIRDNRKQELLNDGDDLLQLTSEVSSRCRTEFQSRIQSSKSIVQATDTVQELCTTQFSSLDNDITNYENTVNSLSESISESRKNDLLNRGNNLISQIRSETSDDCQSEFENRVNEAISIVQSKQTVQRDCVDIFSQIDSDVSSYERTVNRLSSPISEQRREDLLSRGDSLIQLINQEVSSRCQSEFRNRVSLAQNTVLRTEISQPDCEEQFSDLNDEVLNYESDVNNLSLSITPQERQEVLDRGRALLQQIQSEASSRCEDRFEDIVRSSLNTVRRRRIRLPSCGEQFPEVDQKVQDFEIRILQLEPPINPQIIQEFSREGQELIDEINGATQPGRCRAGFINRIRTAVGRLQSLSSRLRITQIEDARAREAEETVQRLQEAINRITIRSGRSPVTEQVQ